MGSELTMNLFSRLALALSMSTLVACGGAAASRAPTTSLSSLDDAAWRPSDGTEMKFEPKVASNAPITREEAPPVAMKPNHRENQHGLLNAVRQ